jgi:2-phosphosulfolactate phosphatase
MKTLEVLFSPAEFAGLPQRDLSRTVCVVFDVLRATSTIVTALANGATAVIPAAEISEALAWREKLPGVLLAGERDGIRLSRAVTGGVEFDLGNSPREFTPDIVRGKTIVTTTTNGTRALRACAAAESVLAGSFLNLRATAQHLAGLNADNVLLVCSGTGETAALEDTLAAGALVNLIDANQATLTDSARIARELFLRFENDLVGAIALSTNGSRLLANPTLREDVAFCLRRDVFDLMAEMTGNGRILKAN